MIGMALASVLGIQLSVEPEREDLERLCEHVVQCTHQVPSFGTFGSVASVLCFVAQNPVPMPEGQSIRITTCGPPKNPSKTFKIWFMRMTLQTVWRWRRIQHQTTIIDPDWVVVSCRPLLDGDPVPTVFKTIWVLILATCLGVTLDMHDLYPPSDK